MFRDYLQIAVLVIAGSSDSVYLPSYQLAFEYQVYNLSLSFSHTQTHISHQQSPSPILSIRCERL